MNRDSVIRLGALFIENQRDWEKLRAKSKAKRGDDSKIVGRDLDD
jgi:hypothetical protein